MKLSYRLIVFFTLTFLFCKEVHSTHIIGGELRYECLDSTNNIYKITLKIYRDCSGGNASFDSTLFIAIYGSSENLITTGKGLEMILPPSDTLDNNTYNLCLFAPPDICVEEAIYTGVYIFGPNPDPGGYYITYQRCCRNAGIINIPNPLNQGASWYLSIPGTSVAVCNSSPYFINYPPTIICLNDTFKYDNSAIDPDGDSLVYELCAATTDDFIVNGFPVARVEPPDPPSQFFNVNYIAPPYSPTYPIFAPIDSFKIDPQTGYLTGTPTQVGLYVVAVCVSEYRDGVLLSKNKRDFQFNVSECIEEVFAGFTIMSPPACDDLTVSFSNTSNKATFYHWDFGLDPLGTGTDTSALKNPTFTYPDFGNYNVNLVVNMGFSCADTTSLGVSLFESPLADAGDDAVISLGDSVTIGGDTTATGGTPPYTYLWTPGNTLNNPTLANPTATPSDTLDNIFTITVTDANGCQNIDIDTVNIRAIDSRIAIPSAFTPNNDGLNDTLFLLPLGIKKLIDFKIYNRWGELVFETQDIKQGWDGNFKEEPQEIGRYVYFYIAETTLGDRREGKGDVALIR